MEARFSGFTILFNSRVEISDRIEIKISYLTAFLFVDDKNIASFYPSGLTVDVVADIIEELCCNYGLETDREKIQTAAWKVYMIIVGLPVEAKILDEE